MAHLWCVPNPPHHRFGRKGKTLTTHPHLLNCSVLRHWHAPGEPDPANPNADKSPTGDYSLNVRSCASVLKARPTDDAPPPATLTTRCCPHTPHTRGVPPSARPPRERLDSQRETWLRWKLVSLKAAARLSHNPIRTSRTTTVSGCARYFRGTWPFWATRDSNRRELSFCSSLTSLPEHRLRLRTAASHPTNARRWNSSSMRCYQTAGYSPHTHHTQHRSS